MAAMWGLPETLDLTIAASSAQPQMPVAIQVSQGPVAIPVSMGMPLSLAQAQAWQLEQQSAANAHMYGSPGQLYGSPMQMCFVQQALPIDASTMQLMAERQALQAAAAAAAAAKAPAQEPQQSNNSTIFFCGVTPVVAVEALLGVFAQFGRVMDLNLFRPYKGCRTSKGCGLVVYSKHAEAAAALEALNGKYVWPGARSPIVIEWCDPSKQFKKRRAQPLAPTVLQHQHMLAFTGQAMHPVLPGTPLTLGLAAYGNMGGCVMPGY